MEDVREIVRLLNAAQFEGAIPRATELLRNAAAEAPDRLREAARGVVAWQGFFANSSQAIASEPYFRAVYTTLAELAGPDSPAAMAAAENLAGIVGSIDKIDEAIALREKVMVHAAERYPKDDARYLRVRDGLAFLYRRAGREESASAQYENTGVCAHLHPAEQYLRAQGAKIASCCQPWTANCHIWVYFDAVLDCERLIQTLQLDACVQVHDHRGTHDGSERGIVCTVHHDGILGTHPADAGPMTRTIA
jgi:hypothetical protein